MLRSLKDFVQYAVEADDGNIGYVDNFYFNDEHWTIRYIIVETARFLFGKKVLISPRLVKDEPDWENHQFEIDLTKEQIKNSPDIDLARPVSREKEIELAQYYQWPMYWNDYTEPFLPYYVSFLHTREVSEETNEPDSQNENHLRSLKEILNYHVNAINGDIGQISDVIVDDIHWKIQFFAVNIKDYHPGKKVLISPSWINKIDWNSSSIFLDHSITEIIESFEYTPSEPVNLKLEKTFYDYYGRPSRPLS